MSPMDNAKAAIRGWWKLLWIEIREENALKREFEMRRKQLRFFQKNRRKFYNETGEIQHYFR